jgi:hypothetical protein
MSISPVCEVITDVEPAACGLFFEGGAAAAEVIMKRTNRANEGTRRGAMRIIGSSFIQV